ECNFKRVRCLRRTRLDIPATVEFVAGGRPFRVRGFNLEPVAAPVHRHFQLGLAGCADVDRALGDRLRELDRFVVPVAATAIPLVVSLNAYQRPERALQRFALAVRIDGDDGKSGCAALGNLMACEVWPDADHAALRAYADLERSLDG